MALSLLLDEPQPRLSVDSLSTLVSGRDWSLSDSSADVYVDFLTNTAFLRPAPTYDDWTASNAGIFAKYGLADFALTDPGNWKPHDVDAGGSYYLYQPSGPNTGVFGVGPMQDRNQAMVIEFFVFGDTNAPYGVFDCGWSNTGDMSAGVGLHFYGDGNTQVWKEGIHVGDGSIGGNSKSYFAVPTGSPPTGPQGQGIKGQYITVMLIPCRDRELLVLSSLGGGFCHTFTDLSEQVANQIITPGETFWFAVPAPVAPVVRIAQLMYAPSGFICGTPSAWRDDPGDTFNKVIFQQLSDPQADPEAMELIDGPNPYGADHPVQLKINLTGGGTPFIYGARAWTDAVRENTAAGEGGSLDLLPYCTAFDLDVSDAIGGTRATATLHAPQAIADAGGVGIMTQCQRPLKILGGGFSVVTGVCEPPHWTDGFGFDDDGYDLNQTIELQVRDYWKLAEEYIFSDPIPLDGMTLYDAYTLVARMIGFPDPNISSAAMGFALPQAGTSSGGDWNFLIDVGDKGSEILDRLHQTYAGTWFHGIDSEGVLQLLAPADMPSTSSVTLYRTLDDAISGGAMLSEAAFNVYRSFKQSILEPEANDLYVMGFNFVTQRPLIAHYKDGGSVNPMTAPALRPANWLGFLRKYGWVDPSITTMDTAMFVLGLLKDRLTIPRYMVEFQCEYLPGVNRGDLVTLANANPDNTDIVCRIKTFSGSFQQEDTDTLNHWRPCRYTAEIYDPAGIASPLGVHGTNLTAIARNWALNALSKRRVFGWGQLAARRSLQSAQAG